MDQQTRDAVTFLLGTFLTLCLIAGMLTRWVLLPYLRDHLIAPVQETHSAVTENHHASAAAPTLPDRLEDVHGVAVEALQAVKALARVMDAHMDWSDRWTSLWEREITNLKQRKEGTTDDENPAT